MKDHYLDLHSAFCKNGEWSSYCDSSPFMDIVFIGNDFHLLRYNSCMEYGDKYSFIIQICELILDKIDIIEYSSLSRGHFCDQDIRDFRTKNIPMKKYFKQVHFIYGNGSRYAITSKIKYLDQLCDQEIIDENYQKAKEYIQKYDRRSEHLKDELIKLYDANRLYVYDEIEIHKTIDHLIKSINQLTK